MFISTQKWTCCVGLKNKPNASLHTGPGSDGNKEVLHIPQNSSIIEASPTYYSVSYQDTRWWGWFFFPAVEMQ